MSIQIFPVPLQSAHSLRYIEAIECPRVNARLTGFRHPGTADSEGFFGNVDAPHHLREAERRTELMRATNALCTWEPNPFLIGQFPTWAVKRINHGNLTSEDDGKDCKAYRASATGE